MSKSGATCARFWPDPADGKSGTTRELFESARRFEWQGLLITVTAEEFFPILNLLPQKSVLNNLIGCGAKQKAAIRVVTPVLGYRFCRVPAGLGVLAAQAPVGKVQRRRWEAFDPKWQLLELDDMSTQVRLGQPYFPSVRSAEKKSRKKIWGSQAERFEL